MIRTLSIVAFSAFVLAVACIGASLAISGPDLAKQGFPLRGQIFHFGWFDDDDGHDWGGPQATREIPWSAGHQLVFLHGADVRFKQGPERKMTVTGPASAVNRLRMENGALMLESRWAGLPHLTIEATAPDIDSFKILGSADVAITDFDQDHLDIEIDGDGHVTAAGKARDIGVTILGNGDVDVGAVAASQARVRIMGSGDTSIAPTDTADIDIAGSGDVTLMSDPPHVNTDIKGSGNIVRRAPPPAEPTDKTAKPI